MIGQSLLVELEAAEDGEVTKGRGRPAVQIGFNRSASHVVLLELDVNKARCSLIDYRGALVDRIETPITPHSFDAQTPVEFLAARVGHIKERNPRLVRSIHRAALSVQGILDANGTGLRWSPVPNLAGHNLSDELSRTFGIPVNLYKRGRLLAEGTRWLYPELNDADVATVFVGSTVAMGISMSGGAFERGEDTATEFGHMVHIADGALCRCGTYGCIEAYASDYGILRSTFGVPDRTPPAHAVPAEQFSEIITRASAGDRNAIHAFNLAGAAIGYGINRFMTVFAPTHVVLVGPGARAFPLMKREIKAALSASLLARLKGAPKILTQDDEDEPVFKGLAMKALASLDHKDFAAMPSPASRGEA
jgi:predicted NBD/HSP70 family sugar kinase